MTYAFTGCSGPVVADAPVTFDFGPLADLGGPGLTAPVVHGVYQIVMGWTGATKALERSESSPAPPVVQTTDIAEARKMRHWRELAVPAGWAFDKAQGGGYEISPVDGYCGWYVTATGEPGLEICGKKGVRIWYGASKAAWHNGTSVRETRVVAGRPASVIYNKTDAYFPLTLRVYDAPHRSSTRSTGGTAVLGGNVDAVIAIAESLFALPNEPEPSPPSETRSRPHPPSAMRPARPLQRPAWSGDGYNCALTDSPRSVCWVSDGFWGLLPPDPPPGEVHKHLRVAIVERRIGLALHHGLRLVADTGDIVCWQGAHTSGEPQSRATIRATTQRSASWGAASAR